MNNIKAEYWGPHFWYTLHSICENYPFTPNSITKKKYYDFISNIPIFLPDHSFGDKFAELLDQYPLKPYLDSREQLTKWMHFIHNIINKHIGKPIFSFNNYILKYRIPPQEYKKKTYIKDYISWSIIASFILLIYLFYKK